MNNLTPVKMMNKFSIVFFDGFCILCNGLVNFLIKRDKKDKFRFAALQGKTARQLLPENIITQFDSVVFITNDNNTFTKSKAVVQILCTLGGPWRVAFGLLIIPNFIRDYIYDYIAKRRFNWFGKRDSCRLPAESEKGKILP